MNAGAGRSAGPDEIAGLECRESADVVDQPGKPPGQAIGRVLLPQLPVHARHHAQRFCRIELVGGHHPGTEAARLVEVLALRDIECAVP